MAAAAIHGYYSIGEAYYQGLRVPQGTGMTAIVPEELAVHALFLVFGLVAGAGLLIAVSGTSFPEAASRLCATSVRRTTWIAAALAGFVVLACYGLAVFVLGGAVTTDDEHVYRFVAQTLRTGSWTAPSPGGDLDFFREQFVVLDGAVRYGKYPPGFPFLLALGQAAGLEALVVPLVTGSLLLGTWRLGMAVSGPGTATLAAVLFAVSPQVLLTGATFLSQPLSALTLVAGTLLLWKAAARPERESVLVAAAGCVFAYGVVVRPLPGVLFAAVAVLLSLTAEGSPWRRARRAALLCLPLLAGLAVLLAVNKAQAGDPLTSGYQSAHGVGAGGTGMLALISVDAASVASSLFSAAFRLNVWLFGFPLSLALCLLARRSRTTAALWAFVLAEVCYRVLSPKAGVSGTGPIYVYEMIPLLCVLSADGLRRLWEGEWGALAPASSRLAAPLLLSIVFVNLTLFLPPRLLDLRRMGEAQTVVHRLAARQGLHQAVIFHWAVVPPWTRLSWAYFPRCNSPTLDDDILFLRVPRGQDLVAAENFWRRRFPSRTAWVFHWPQDGSAPTLAPLATAIAPVAGPGQ